MRLNTFFAGFSLVFGYSYVASINIELIEQVLKVVGLIPGIRLNPSTPICVSVGRWLKNPNEKKLAAVIKGINESKYEFDDYESISVILGCLEIKDKPAFRNKSSKTYRIDGKNVTAEFGMQEDFYERKGLLRITAAKEKTITIENSMKTVLEDYGHRAIGEIWPKSLRCSKKLDRKGITRKISAKRMKIKSKIQSVGSLFAIKIERMEENEEATIDFPLEATFGQKKSRNMSLSYVIFESRDRETAFRMAACQPDGSWFIEGTDVYVPSDEIMSLGKRVVLLIYRDPNAIKLSKVDLPNVSLEDSSDEEEAEIVKMIGDRVAFGRAVVKLLSSFPSLRAHYESQCQANHGNPLARLIAKNNAGDFHNDFNIILRSFGSSGTDLQAVESILKCDGKDSPATSTIKQAIYDARDSKRISKLFNLPTSLNIIPLDKTTGTITSSAENFLDYLGMKKPLHGPVSHIWPEDKEKNTKLNERKLFPNTPTNHLQSSLEIVSPKDILILHLDDFSKISKEASKTFFPPTINIGDKQLFLTNALGYAESGNLDKRYHVYYLTADGKNWEVLKVKPGNDAKRGTLSNEELFSNINYLSFIVYVSKTEYERMNLNVFGPTKDTIAGPDSIEEDGRSGESVDENFKAHDGIDNDDVGNSSSNANNNYRASSESEHSEPAHDLEPEVKADKEKQEENLESPEGDFHNEADNGENSEQDIESNVDVDTLVPSNGIEAILTDDSLKEQKSEKPDSIEYTSQDELNRTKVNIPPLESFAQPMADDPEITMSNSTPPLNEGKTKFAETLEDIGPEILKANIKSNTEQCRSSKPRRKTKKSKPDVKQYVRFAKSNDDDAGISDWILKSNPMIKMVAVASVALLIIGSGLGLFYFFHVYKPDEEHYISDDDYSISSSSI